MTGYALAVAVEMRGGRGYAAIDAGLARNYECNIPLRLCLVGCDGTNPAQRTPHSNIIPADLADG